MQKNMIKTFIYLDFEYLMEKIDLCKSHPENHLQQKWVNIFHQVFECLQSCHLKTENKEDVYKSKDCTKK